MVAEIENQHCLAPRLLSYPVVKAAVDTASTGYRGSKDVRFVGPLVGALEGSLKLTLNTFGPLLNALDGSILSTEKTLCSYLDTVDNKYPAVKSTPEELKESIQTYYGGSAIKPRVDYTVEKAVQIYNLPRASVHYAQIKKDAAVDLAKSTYDHTISTMTRQMHAILDVAEAALDRVTAGPSREGEKGTVTERATALYNRATSDMLTVATRQADFVRAVASGALERLYGAGILLDYARARQEWAKETIASLSNETWALIDSAKGRVLAFGSKLNSIDDLSKEASNVLYGQLSRLNGLLQQVVDFLNERVIPPASGNAKMGGRREEPNGAAEVYVSPKSSTSSMDADESYNESFD